MNLASSLLYLAILTITSYCQGFLLNNDVLRAGVVTDRKSKASLIKNHQHPHRQHQPAAAAAATALVQFEQVYHQYPTPGWARQLFSSEPRRTWALENVTFCWQGELVLLVGASMSGKSTALQLIMAAAQPTHGRVQVSTPPIYLAATKLSPQPGRDHWTVRERLAPWPLLLPALALTESADQTLSQLNLSDQYKLSLAELCINNAAAVDDDDDDATHAPILLLDEWLDKEPTSIVHAIEEALESFVAATKAVVCVVTHKRDRWKTSNRWELRQGKVVVRPWSEKQQ